MYLTIITLTMVVLPLASITYEHLISPADPLIELAGRWFVFWGAGVRLALAALRQIFQPAFTSRQIFRIDNDHASIIVRELGIANFATAVVSLLSLSFPTFILPAAISSGLFYSGAGIGHMTAHSRTAKETIAMVSDLWLAAILGIFVIYRAFS